MAAFRPFDSHKAIEQTWRNLPHSEQSGATYLATFRLADSLPAEARGRLAELHALNDTEAFGWIEHYLDAGSGSCLFAQLPLARIVESALRHFDGKRYSLGAFTVMPNHVHAFVQPLAPLTRSQLIHSWKSYTARELQRAGTIRGQVWQDEGFDRIVRDEPELRRFHDYILANPTAAKLPEGTFIVGEGTASWFSA